LPVRSVDIEPQASLAGVAASSEAPRGHRRTLAPSTGGAPQKRRCAGICSQRKCGWEAAPSRSTGKNGGHNRAMAPLRIVSIMQAIARSQNPPPTPAEARQVESSWNPRGSSGWMRLAEQPQANLRDGDRSFASRANAGPVRNLRSHFAQVTKSTSPRHTPSQT